MATDSELIEEIEFLARSESRIRVLNRVAEETTITSQDLRERLDASRTTIQRNLDALVERGWLQNSNHEYTITPCGDLVTAEFADLVDAIRMIRDLEPFMEWIAIDDLGVDLHQLADADVVAARASDPYAPVNKHTETLRSADEVRALLPSVGRDAMEITSERLSADDPQYELVVEVGCAETLQENPQYAPLFEEAAGDERFTVYVYDGEFPYYLGLLDDVVQLGAEDDEGMPRALLELETPEVRTWAEQIYADYKAAATLLTPKQQAEQRI